MYKRARPNYNARYTPYTGGGKRARYYAPTSAGRTTFSRFNKRTTPRVSTTGTLVKQVKALQSVVNSLAPEIKYSDNFGGAQPTEAGAVVHLTAIPQGDTQTTRTGNTICVKNVCVEGYISRATTDPSVLSDLRFAVVLDKKQVTDTSPTAAQIFQDPANAWSSLPNTANLERFTVLWMSPVYDAYQYGYDTNVLASRAPTQSNKFKFSKNMNLKVSFNGSAGSDIEKNGLYFVCLNSDVTLEPIINAVTRVGFTDV